MKRACILIYVATFAFVPLACHDQQGASPKITTAQIEAAEVTGQLGVPLGECVTIRATIVRTKTYAKDRQGQFFLNVTHVEDRQLRSPEEFTFFVHQFATDNVKIAENDFAVHELVTGNKAGSLSSEQIALLEKGYVGKTVTLIAYETGEFRGMPTRLPEGVGLWQTYGFGFATYLLVMDQL